MQNLYQLKQLIAQAFERHANATFLSIAHGQNTERHQYDNCKPHAGITAGADCWLLTVMNQRTACRSGASGSLCSAEASTLAQIKSSPTTTTQIFIFMRLCPHR